MRRTNRKSWLLLAILAYLASGTCFFRLYHSALDERETPIKFLGVVFSIAMFLHLRCLPKVAWHQGSPSNTRLRATEDQGKPCFRPPFQFYRLARKAADELRVDVDKYLSNISLLAEDFTNSKEIINREGFQAALRQAMMKTQFTLVLGGKSLGKSTIANYTIQKVENEKNSKLTILNVNMREQGSKELFQAIFDSVKSKSQVDFQDVLKRVVVLAVGLAIGRGGSGVGAGAAAAVAQGTLNFLDAVLPSDLKEQALSAVIAEIAKIGNKTCILTDEANMAVPGDDEAQARNALQYFVMLTKETKRASVVLISSEYAYPYRLQNASMNLRDIENIIIANEIPKKEMVEVMVTKWKMSQELAEEFYLYFGGDIDLCKRAVEQLIRNGDNFDPITDVFNSDGLSMCVDDPDAREHLQNMADQGWSPVKKVKKDAAAELIAKENVGGVLPKTAQIFGGPKDMFKDQHEYALVPAGTLMRWKIAKALELPLDTRNSV